MLRRTIKKSNFYCIEPPVPTKTAPDGPLLGNGRFGAVVTWSNSTNASFQPEGGNTSIGFTRLNKLADKNISGGGRGIPSKIFDRF